MENLNGMLVAVSTLTWLALLLPPWQAWRIPKAFAAENGETDLDDVTALIPARNEAPVLHETLTALQAQGDGLRVIVIDDESTDDTAAKARNSGLANLEVLHSSPLPAGWNGKLWALHQGLARVQTPFILLLDADIRLQPGMLRALRRNMQDEGLNMVSLMVRLPMRGFWERLLLPAFVYFFRLVYPFSLANADDSELAAAAGGCALVRHSALQRAGGFFAVRDAVIDDCALAGRIKEHCGRIRIALTHDAVSLRCCPHIMDIVEMIARTAFSQLRYSFPRLALCSTLMLLMFATPIYALIRPDIPFMLQGGIWLAMTAGYAPILRFYRQPLSLALFMPLIGFIYLGATWLSVWRYRQGEKTRWKERSYARTTAT